MSLMFAGDFFGWGSRARESPDSESNSEVGGGAPRHPGFHGGKDPWGQKGGEGGSKHRSGSAVCGQDPQGIPKRRSMVVVTSILSTQKNQSLKCAPRPPGCPLCRGES